MRPEELYQVLRRALDEGVSLNMSALWLVCVLSLLGGFIGSYLRTKGKNLADKEDIAELTNIVECIRAEHSKQLEMLAQQNRLILKSQDQEHELSMAALEKRLAAHQEAYALWWELLDNCYTKEDVVKSTMKCQEWWVNNNLYLSSDARLAFRLAYSAAFNHPDYLSFHEDAKLLKENFEDISRAGEVIIKSVSLPVWGASEFSPLGQTDG